MRRFLGRLLNVLRPHRGEQELTRELTAHLTLLQDEYERRGMRPEEAYRAARVALGGVEQTKELHRDARSFMWLNDARQDVAHAIRLLRRTPLFTLTAALSLAIGIGANSAVFTVANGLLFRPPEGIAAPRTLVDIGTLRGDGGLNPMPFSRYLEVGSRATMLSGVCAQAMFPRAMSLTTSTTTSVESLFGHYVTTDFFTVLGARAAAGRVFDAGDGGARKANPVAVLSHGFWLRRFNRSETVIGQVIRLNGRPFTVVGVASPEFQGAGMVTADVWLPLSPDGSSGSVLAIGRLKDDVSAAQAAAELTAIGATLDRERGETRTGPPLHALPSSRAGGNRNLVIGFAGALMIIVSLVLAVACANVAAIVLARSTARSKEMALRTALGARRERLVRQLLTETVMLFSLGGALGVLLARAMILLVRLLPALPFPVSIPVTLDLRVVAFTTVLSFLAALVSGLAPAFRASKADPLTALKEDAPSPLGGLRLRSMFVVGQVALSVLLIVMAGLFLRALRYAGAADPGFDPHGVEVTSLDLSMAPRADSARLPFWRDLLDAVRQLPDVTSATLARVPPGGFEGIGLGSVAAAGVPSQGEPFVPAWNIVDSGYFATLRIPLIAGRDFGERDVTGAPAVAILGEEIAHRFWPHTNAVGQYLEVSTFGPNGRVDKISVLIVGVVRDVKSSSLIDGFAGSYVYMPLQQGDTPLMTLMTTQMTIVARSRQGQRLSAQLAAVVQKLNPNMAVVRSDTMQDSLALGLAPQRVLTAVTGSFAAVGLLLAAMGIYGVTAYMVARRSREIGIRMALGAQRRDVVGMVLRQGLLLTVLGAAIGLVLAAGASQVISVFLYGLPPLHLPTFLGAALIFVLVGLTACYIPAHRAINVDPMRTLRYD